MALMPSDTKFGCGHCRFRNESPDQIRCLRFPPREATSDTDEMGVIVPREGWCGEYEPRGDVAVSSKAEALMCVPGRWGQVSWCNTHGQPLVWCVADELRSTLEELEARADMLDDNGLDHAASQLRIAVVDIRRALKSTTRLPRLGLP